jgi:hypothetical protein
MATKLTIEWTAMTWKSGHHLHQDERGLSALV